MKRTLGVGIAAVLLGLCLAVTGYTQDTPATDTTEAEEPNVNYGEVVNISTDKVVLLEYNFDTDEEVEVSYVLNADTKFENFTAIDEIQQGDEIEVLFVNRDAQNIATMLTKVKIEDQEYFLDEADSEMDYEDLGDTETEDLTNQTENLEL